MESKSSTSTPTSAVRDHGGTVPRAVLHKKILDTAEARPDASMEDIAESVSGATLSIVEQVLEEYGDPGATDGANDDVATDGANEMNPEPTVDEPDADESSSSMSMSTSSTDSSTASDSSAVPDEHASASSDETVATAEGASEPGGGDETSSATAEDTNTGVTEEDTGAASPAAPTAPVDDADSSAGSDSSDGVRPAALTDKQRETLCEIARQPTATQATLADELGVTSATISQRVNSIEGFDWSDRRAFVDGLFDADSLEEETSRTQVDDDEPVPDVGSAPEETQARSKRVDDSVDGSDAGSAAAVDSSPVAAHEPSTAYSREQLEALTEQLEDLMDRLETLEEAYVPAETAAESQPAVSGEDDSRSQSVADSDTGSGSKSGLLSDPELTHKVLHASLRADTISEDEELRLLKLLTGAETG